MRNTRKGNKMFKRIGVITLIVLMLFNTMAFATQIEIKSMDAIFSMADSLTESKRSLFKDLLTGYFTDEENLEKLKTDFSTILDDNQKAQIDKLGISTSDINNNIDALKTWTFLDRMNLIEYGLSDNQQGVLDLNNKYIVVEPDPGDPGDTTPPDGGIVVTPPVIPPVVAPVTTRKKRTNKKETITIFIEEDLTPLAAMPFKDRLITRGLIHSTLNEPVKSVIFNDSKSHWANDSISFFADRDIIKGKGEGNFEPDSKITEAEILALLTRIVIENNELVNIANIEMTEISDEKWYKDVYKRAYLIGLLDLDDEIDPDGYPTRERIVSLIVNSMNILGFEFTDNEKDYISGFTDFNTVSDEYAEAMIIAINKKLINGNNNALTPKRTISRAEVVTILERYYKNIIKKFYQEGVI